MKRNVIGILSLVVLSVLLNTTGAFAQSAKADVPFAFTVGGAQMPSGCYTIEPNSVSSIAVRNCETRRAVLAAAQRDDPSNTSGKLVFRHVGNRYFLIAIQGDASYRLSGPNSKLLKELEMANAPSQTGQVTVALK